MFTLTETKTDTKTETHAIPTEPNDISISVQNEHFHTIKHKPFFIDLCIGLCQCEHITPEIEDDTMTTLPNGVCVLVQYEYL